MSKQTVALAIAIGMTAFLGLAAASAKETLTDDEIMGMAAIEWAGLNCGTLIPNEDYWKALLFMQKKVDPEKVDWYRRRIRAMLGRRRRVRSPANWCMRRLDMLTDRQRVEAGNRPLHLHPGMHQRDQAYRNAIRRRCNALAFRLKVAS